MSRSTRGFQRWIAHDPSTWSFQIFQKYDSELLTIWGAHRASARFTYSQLKKNGADWPDLPRKYFDMNKIDWNKYDDLRAWSDAYNLFDNWVNLSVVLTTASNLETYLASVIAMALDSDPGLVLGVSKSIDGATVLKHRRPAAFQVGQQIDSCTRGDWSSRLDSFEKLFGQCPKEFRSGHAELEELRGIRNRVGHAFGRDIEAARLHGVLQMIPMEQLTGERAERLRKSVWFAAKSIDKFLLKNHIGDFETVRFYHHLYPSLHKHVSTGQRAVYLKKAIGRFGAIPRDKKYCKELVEYWEAL
ncbi:MAG: hypothetical protein WBB34_02465 [Xanthobacteraceae bacterium]